MSVNSETAYELAQTMTKMFVFFRPRKFVKEIKPTEMMVMINIAFISKDNKIATPSKISEELGLSKSALTAVLNSLEKKGLVDRALSKDDRRMIYVTLTEKSKNLLDKFHSDFHGNVNNKITNLAEHLGEDDTEKLIELLKKAYTYLNENAK